MKLTLKELIIIVAVLTFSFPVVYVLMMLATGSARIEFNQPVKAKKDDKEVKLMKLNAKKDSLASMQSQTFFAIEKQKADLDEQKKKMSEQQDHVLMVEQELEKTRNDLTEERKKLEKLVGQSDELDKKRIKQLAKVYSAMRPEEAARILETLDDDLLINILGAMGDDRQKAKILSILSPDKASRVSKKIGKPLKSKK
jgi:flagellar motility protein MotE (MotC chaperone)